MHSMQDAKDPRKCTFVMREKLLVIAFVHVFGQM